MAINPTNKFWLFSGLQHLVVGVILVLSAFTQASGQSIAAGAIGYAHDSAGIYSVYVKYYFPCPERSMMEDSIQLHITSGPTQDSITLGLLDSGDHNLYCTDTFSCTKSNSFKYRYLLYGAKIDLNASPWNSSDTLLFVNEHDVVFDTAHNPTNCAVFGYYLRAYLDRSLGENSNTGGLYNTPFLHALLNSGAYYAFGSIDSADHDSLAYNIYNFDGSLSCGKYFNVYDPGGTGTVNPDANPPIGFYFDDEIGQFIFTPVNAQDKVAWQYNVRDHRRDTANNMVMVGNTSTQMITRVYGDTTNATPKLSGPYLYRICPGEQLRFTIDASDNPASGIYDTLDMHWNGAIADATFDVSVINARLRRGTFTWTPDDDDASPYPYSFKVTSVDNHCSLAANSSRMYSILVEPPVFPVLDMDSLGCNRYAIQLADTGTAGTGQTLFTTEVLDTGGQVVDNVYFTASGVHTSVFRTDTVQFRGNGTFIVRVTAQNSAGCTRVTYDTLEIDSAFDFHITRKHATVCPTIDSLFAVIDSFDNQQFSIEWNSTPSDSNVYFPLIAHSLTTGQINVSLSLTDQRGCVTTKSERLNVYGFKKLDTANFIHLSCNNDYHELRTTLDPATRPFRWNTGDSVQVIQVLDGGEYRVHTRTDSGCYFSDSVVLDPTPLPVISIANKDSICPNEQIQATIREGGVYQSIVWSTGSLRTSTLPNFSTTYWVKVTATSSCEFTDTVTGIYQYPPIKTNLINDTTVSCDGDTVILNALQPGVVGVMVEWSTGETTRSIQVVNPGYYSYRADDSHCVVTDTTFLVRVESPNAELPDTVNVCYDYPSVVSARGNQGSGVTYYWNGVKGGPQIVVDSQSILVLRITKRNVCEDTDTAQVVHLPQIATGFGQLLDTVCAGKSIALDPGIVESKAAIAWSTGDTTPILSVDTAGRYTLEASWNGCTFRDTVLVGLYDNPSNVDLGPDRIVCSYSNVVLSVSPIHNDKKFLWSDSSTGTTLPTSDAGEYWVRVTNLQGCSTSDTMYLTRKAKLPSLSVQVAELCFGDTVHFDLSDADSVLWYLPDSTVADTNYIVLSYLDEGRTDYVVVDTSLGVKCQHTGSVTIDYKGTGQVFGKLLTNSLIPVRNERVQLVQIKDNQAILINEMITDNNGEYSFYTGCPDSVVVRGETNPGQFKGYSPRTVDINKARMINIGPGDIEVMQVIMQDKPDPGPGELAGMILDSTTNASIDGLEIFLVDVVSEKPVAMDTTVNGRFVFSDVPYGSYAVFVDRWGFINTTTDRIPLNQFSPDHDTLRYTMSDRYLHLQNLLSVETLNQQQVRIYPNPVSDRLHIRTEGTPAKVQILASDGRLVYEGTGAGEVDVNVSGWPSGVYHVKLISDGLHSTVYRVMVMKR